jgi:hypothetical protein
MPAVKAPRTHKAPMYTTQAKVSSAQTPPSKASSAKDDSHQASHQAKVQPKRKRSEVCISL